MVEVRGRLAHLAVALAVTVTVMTLATSSAWATFPGQNGPIALSVDHVGYVQGIAKLSPSLRGLDMEQAPESDFFLGCRYQETEPDNGPCNGQLENEDLSGHPSFSADGQQIVTDDGGHLLFINTADNSQRPLPKLTGLDINPTWTPTGTWIVFTGYKSRRSSEADLYRVHPDGTGLHKLITNADDATVSPNGHLIVFDRPAGARSRDLWVMNGNGTHPHRLIQTAMDANFSPDGKQLLFVTGKDLAEGDTYNLNVQRANINGSGRTTIVHHAGDPVWSPDGTTIAYVYNARDEVDSAVDTIPVSGGKPTFIAGDGAVSEDSPHFGWLDWESLH